MENIRIYYLLPLICFLSTLSIQKSIGQEVKISNELEVPVTEVKLTGGVLKKTFDQNITYLLNNYSENDLLFKFRERAGNSNPPGKPINWDYKPPKVTGSIAGLFLMGSGNALRWTENEALSMRMNKVIDGIEACKKNNGFIMAYPEEETNLSENANYVRSWVTHGLIDASIAGNPKALKLIRGQLDWFNRWPGIDKVVDNKNGYIANHWIPYQGMISSTRMYLTPLGKKEDIELIYNHYQEDWWLNQLIAKDDKAIYNRPDAHGYEITAFEAYLDLYRISSDKKYLEAVLNAWEMLREKWEMPGGSFALCERKVYPPKSYLIGAESRSGELCVSVFWVKLNQRLHQLFPEIEVYVNEMEKTIYSACLGQQIDTSMINYSNVLHGEKPKATCPPYGTCCEGQGTRIYGSLPEFLYSLSDDGIYVDMYAPSEISWKKDKANITLRNKTSFPEDENILLEVATSEPVLFDLSLRIPAYASQVVDILVNGKSIGSGIPGSFKHIKRPWKNGDKVSFTIPLDFKLTKYSGFDQIEGFNRYSLEYGPVLLGLSGKFNFKNICTRILNDPNEIRKWLAPVPDKPLHFRIKVDSGDWNLRDDEAWGENYFEYKPYYEIGLDEQFTVFPIIQF
jgi:DUF1680 family protein